MSSSAGLRSRATNGTPASKPSPAPTGVVSRYLVTEHGRKTDAALDKHDSWEFGGPWGVVAMMAGFPCLMYYLWICLWFEGGKLVRPSDLLSWNTSGGWLPWARGLVEAVKRVGRPKRIDLYVADTLPQDAAPTPFAFKAYGGLIAVQLALAWVMPGLDQEGETRQLSRVGLLANVALQAFKSPRSTTTRSRTTAMPCSRGTRRSPWRLAFTSPASSGCRG